MEERTKRHHAREFRLQVVRQLINGEKRLCELCREHGLSERLVHKWRETYEAEGESAWLAREVRHARPKSQEAKIAELEAALGRAHLENELLRRALKKGGLPLPRSGS
jgi:transposase